MISRKLVINMKRSTPIFVDIIKGDERWAF